LTQRVQRLPGQQPSGQDAAFASRRALDDLRDRRRRISSRHVDAARARSAHRQQSVLSVPNARIALVADVAARAGGCRPPRVRRLCLFEQRVVIHYVVWSVLGSATSTGIQKGGTKVQLGMIGLGRMGANMVRRLMRDGHTCVVYDRSAEAVQAMVKEGATGADSPAHFVAQLTPPRAIWLMVPAAVVDRALDDLAPLVQSGDTIVDGGNSYYVDDIRRSARLLPAQVAYVDVGTSGGVWGLERGFCLMIGGSTPAFEQLEPIFRSLAPGSMDNVPRTPGRTGPPSMAELGYLHCGPSGAGHFVKMVHNAIEYGLMEAYAEGLNVLHRANAGKADHAVDAETAPLLTPENYQYDLDLTAITEVWRRGSVVSSWLLDLAAGALLADPSLAQFAGHVSDSGEGRWTARAAIDEGTPAPVLTAALFQRFSSRGEDVFAEKLLSALRSQFGGHVERTP
jgi:6-phosphogluconate dehydrogenase